tara:strand:+ start:269 stop:865 length:597 start_codon:yes stop_codon:yes gene_type:complete
MEICDSDINAVYQFVYGKRDELLSSVTNYVLRFQFKSQFSEEELDDILDLLVENGKLKTNGTRLDPLRSFWIRRDPDKYTPEEDKGGFLTPSSPGHSLKLLNSYMRTDLLKFIHGNVYKRKDAFPEQSPLNYLVGAINDVLASWKESNLFECFNKNPYHINPDFDFDAEEDFSHDIKLMTFHLKALRRTLKEIEKDAI